MIKHVINDNGGTKTASDFAVTVTGNSPSPTTFQGAESPGTNVAISTGSYSVEEGAHAGYTETKSADCSGTIAIGDTKTCTITNDDIGPKLIVIKHVINDNGGTKTASDFTMTVTGGSPTPASFPGAESPGTQVGLATGQYSVDEGAHAGYTETMSADCSGTIAIGDTKTCTITNDDIAPKLHLRKVVVNDNGGTKTVADFTLTADGTGSNDLSGTSPVDSGATLKADTFTLSETQLAGYTASAWVCVGGSQNGTTITVGLAGEATCTITNNDIAPPPVTPAPVTPPPPPTIDLQITKSAAPSPTTVGTQVTWTMVVKNNGPSNATGVKMADPVPAGVTFVSVTSTQGTCTGGALVSCTIGNMNVGASVTITLVTTAAATGTISNTATTVGNETETNTANNTASAQVVVNGVFTPPVTFCTAVSVSPKQLIVGRKNMLTLKLTSHGKAKAGVKVKIKGSKILLTTKPSNGKGIVKQTVKPMKAGIVVFQPVATKSCKNPRIGVIGVFTPPVTG